MEQSYMLFSQTALLQRPWRDEPKGETHARGIWGKRLQRVGTGTLAKCFFESSDQGEEAFAAVTEFANENTIKAASVTAIGAFAGARVG